jgi:lysophospholipid acyltransferase (LPLAT)-like uncharacterized protein
MLKRLVRHPAAQGLLAWLLGTYLDFALRTTRWHFEGAEHAAPFGRDPSGEGPSGRGLPLIAAFWHERLPLMIMLCLRAQHLSEWRGSTSRMHVLVSRHRDGRFIGAVLRRFGIDVVLGSSSRGGAAGMLGMLALLGAGHHIAITPDGPRGPRRVGAPGVAQLAALSGAPVLPCAAQTSRRWEMKTWDRMAVPKPFGRGVLVCGPTIAVPRDGWQAALPVIAAALDAAAERADRLCAG